MKRLTSPKIVLLAVFVLMILFIITLTGLPSDEIQARIAIMNLVLVVGLVMATLLYADSTEKIAKETKRQAEASLKMAEEMKEQRYGDVLPVVDIQLEPSATEEMAKAEYAGKVPTTLPCKLSNIGLGPALDVCSVSAIDGDRTTFVIVGALGVDKEVAWNHFAVGQEDDKGFIAVYYRDVYDRDIEARREVRPHNTDLGPLEVRTITKQERDTLLEKLLKS